MPKPPKEMLKPEEAAHALGITTQTLRRWALEGRIPNIKLHNGHRRYRAVDVDAYLEAHQVQS